MSTAATFAATFVSSATAFVSTAAAFVSTAATFVSTATAFVSTAATFATTLVRVAATRAGAAVVDEFTVKPLLEFLFSGFAYGDNLAGEMQGLSSHTAVEIHPDGSFVHLNHNSRDDLSGLIDQRYRSPND